MPKNQKKLQMEMNIKNALLGRIAVAKDKIINLNKMKLQVSISTNKHKHP